MCVRKRKTKSPPATTLCPFCGGDICRHFIGWTGTGLMADPLLKGRKAVPIRGGDVLVPERGSVRVYRPDDLPDRRTAYMLDADGNTVLKPAVLRQD